MRFPQIGNRVALFVISKIYPPNATSDLSQLCLRHQANRIQIPDITTPQLLTPFRIIGRIHPRSHQLLQMPQGGQDQNADSRQPLLTINNIKPFIIRGLQHQIPHIMSRLAILLKEPQNVLPQIIPLILRPRIIPLERRNSIGQPIPHHLSEC